MMFEDICIKFTFFMLSLCITLELVVDVMVLVFYNEVKVTFV